MDLINYLDELKELATMNLTASEMAEILNEKYNTNFDAKQVAFILARKNILYRTTYSGSKVESDESNQLLWIIRNLNRYGNCLVGSKHQQKKIDKIIKKLHKLNYNINVRITESNSVILEVQE